MLKKVVLISAIAVSLSGCEALKEVSGSLSELGVPGMSGPAANSSNASATERSAAACSGSQPVENLSFTDKIKLKAIEFGVQKIVKSATGSEDVYKSDTVVDNTCKADKVLAQSEMALDGIASIVDGVDKQLLGLGVSADELGELRVKRKAFLSTPVDNNNAEYIKNKAEYFEVMKKISSKSPKVAKEIGIILYQSMIGSTYRLFEASQNIGKAAKFAKEVPVWAIQSWPTLKKAAGSIKPLMETGKNLYETAKEVTGIFDLSPAEINSANKKEKTKVGNDSDLG